MSKHDRLRLQAPAEAYMRHKLHEGLTLSRMVALQAPLIEEVFTFLPAPYYSPAQKSTPEEFDWGLYLSRGDGQPGLVSFIKERMSEQTSACLMESFDCKRSQGRYRNLQTRYLFYDEEIYHLCLPEDSTSFIKGSIEEAETHYFFWGFIAEPGALLKLRTGSEISIDDLRYIASTLSYIFTCAWDNEGYLIAAIKRH